ncbi:MAG: hypothetical protein H6625_10895 [Bdellovibrionaceae bacterium]|nr:hypothetical protein [Pseudobdellovibrionaceae bacterium]
MSSVNGSDSQKNRYEETIRNQREDYQQKESETVKKHNKELRRISEAHQKEVEKIRQDHTSQLGEYSNRMRGALSVKDKHYQQEIANLKKLHRDQYAKIKDEQNQQLEATRTANAKNNMQRENMTTLRMNSLNDHYNETLREKDEKNTEKISQLSESQAAALKDQRKRLVTAHSEEIGALQQTRQEQLNEKQRAYENLRQSTAGRLKQQETRHFLDKQRSSDAHMSHNRQREVEFSDEAQHTRESFKDSMNDLKREHADRERQHDFDRNQSHLDFKFMANKDLTQKVGRLEDEIKEVKFQEGLKDKKDKRQSEKEIKNIRNAFQKNIDLYKEQNEILAEDFKKSNAEDINKVSNKMSKQMRDNTKFYQRQMEVENFKSRSALDSIQSDFDSRSNQTEKIADMKIKQIYENTNNRIKSEDNRSQNQIELLKKDNEKEKLDLQIKLNQEKNQKVLYFKEKMQQMQTEQDLKLMKMKADFDKNLADMHQKQTLEKAQMRNQTKSKVEGLQRNHAQEMSAVKMGFEQKLEQVNQQHRMELQRMNAQHEKQLDDVITTFNKA